MAMAPAPYLKSSAVEAKLSQPETSEAPRIHVTFVRPRVHPEPDFSLRS
jgi:hypothetical protein